MSRARPGGRQTTLVGARNTVTVTDFWSMRGSLREGCGRDGDREGDDVVVVVVDTIVDA